MPTKATLVDVCLLDEREKVLQAPLVSAVAVKWLRAQRRLQGVLRLKGRAQTEGDPNESKRSPCFTLMGFRSEVGRMLGRNDLDWILDRQAGWALAHRQRGCRVRAYTGQLFRFFAFSFRASLPLIHPLLVGSRGGRFAQRARTTTRALPSAAFHPPPLPPKQRK